MCLLVTLPCPQQILYLQVLPSADILLAFSLCYFYNGYPDSSALAPVPAYTYFPIHQLLLEFPIAKVVVDLGYPAVPLPTVAHHLLLHLQWVGGMKAYFPQNLASPQDQQHH